VREHFEVIRGISRPQGVARGISQWWGGFYGQVRHFARVKGYFEAVRAFCEGEGVFRGRRGYFEAVRGISRPQRGFVRVRG